jgi:hypothetical protein
MDNLTPFEASYLETALWSSTDSKGTPLDDSKYADVELALETIQRIKTDCAQFLQRVTPIIDGSTPDYPVAHDFWLTRNRHGAGFWDGDYPEPLGKQLTDIAHSFGECDLYIGDNGQFYIAGGVL